jgi:ectoine hydroxylase-related dioxygenase (phytanoyl-CoA dioxygenase family)
VHLPQALDAEVRGLAQAAFDWSIAHPGPAAGRPYAGTDGEFYQDLCNTEAWASPPYRQLLQAPSIARIVEALWGSPEVWFMYEQIFLKEGAASRRSPWHQDSTYLSVDGHDLAVMWITFDHVAKEDSLEFVRGSHRGTLFNTSKFAGDDDTEPIADNDLPRLPDIEKERGDWDIVSWAVEPGDVLVFHPAMLHGGAGTRNGARRRTLSLRFFGQDAVYALRAGKSAGPMVKGLHRSLQPGDPFRYPAFPKLLPVAVSQAGETT